MGFETISSTKSLYTKVFVVVALLACINVVSASVSKGVAHNSQPLETLNLDPDISKRFLRTDISMTDDGINTFQGRALAISLPGLENVASRVKSSLSQLIQKLKLKWWKLRNKSPNDVFTLLKLDKTGDKLFESPVFNQWVSFVSVRSKNDPDAAMFFTLASHYSDDALAKMLLSAKEVESTKTFATKLEGIQIANWVKSGNSADDVFKALKLDQTGDKLFESPMFTYWSSFVAKRYSNNPGSEMFSTFGLHYTDEALAKILPTKILISAKNVDSTKAQATKLEGLQISNWINGDKSADDVFKLLKLDETGDELFKSPLFSTWTTFVTKINKNNYEADIFKLLTDKLGDAALARMISAANNVDDTKKLATGLRAEQFTSWFSAGKTPQNVDTILNAAANSDDMTKKISQDYAKFFEKADERLSMVN